MASIFVALYAIDISTNFISVLYVKIEGHYLPYGGIPYEYYFWQLFLTGALCVVMSYVFLYNVKKNTYITSIILLIPFMIDTVYTYKFTGKPYPFNYEIILGGLIFIVLYEAIKKINASNKQVKIVR